MRKQSLVDIGILFILLFCKKQRLIKSVTTIIFACIVVAAGSCKKSPATDHSLTGRWRIINDSTFLEGTPFFQGSHSNYIGVTTDYYHFTSGGNLYIREGTILDTATYTLVSCNQVTIVYYYANGTIFPDGAIRGTYNISELTEHSVTLSLSGLTPEGQEIEIINLNK